MKYVNQKTKIVVDLRQFVILYLLVLLSGSLFAQEKDARFITFTTEPANINFYWKDDSGKILGSLQHLKSYVEAKGKELRFAMNGGMYLRDQSPQGLYI